MSSSASPAVSAPRLLPLPGGPHLNVPGRDQKFLDVAINFTNEVFVSSFLMPIYELGDLADVGRRTGMVLLIAGVGALVGPPISGAINDQSGGFKMVGVYAGPFLRLSTDLMITWS